MAAATMVSLGKYLRAAYEPDCEWVNGQLKERATPDGYHAYFQGFFLMFFESRRVVTGLRALGEVRMRVSADRYRIPDVMVIPADARFLPLPTVTPVICIEILSPDDRVSDLQEKIEDYVRMGVGAIWIVDPRRRAMSTADAGGIHNVQAFELAGVGIRIESGELFAELDELEGKEAR